MRALRIAATLCDVMPPIWRRLLVAEESSLEDLHETLQIAMGWLNCHLYSFEMDGRTYLDPELVVDPYGDWQDAREMLLSDLDLEEGTRFRYTYDFGDGWEHVLLVEAVQSSSGSEALPVCLEGRRACPPEDCGGAWSYARLTKAVAEPDGVDPELLEWIPDGFDPARFDLAQVNELLRSWSCAERDGLRGPSRGGQP